MGEINFVNTFIQLLGPSLIIFILHFKIEEYPEPFPLSINPKREILETLEIYAIINCVLLILIFGIHSRIFAGISDLTLLALLDSLLIHIPEFLLLFYYSIHVKKWTLKDLGFTSELKSKNVTFLAIIYGLIIGLIGFFLNVLDEPYPIGFLILSIFTNAFMEEFIYRSIIQSKLERAIGQWKAWFFTGIMFGFAHIIADTAGVISGEGAIIFVLILFGKIFTGMILGIMYMKTRSLIPVVACHYLLNWTPAIILLFIS